LRELLNCYACRNPYIGYCQGLNFIAGELIKMGFSNEVSKLFINQQNPIFN